MLELLLEKLSSYSPPPPLVDRGVAVAQPSCVWSLLQRTFTATSCGVRWSTCSLPSGG